MNTSKATGILDISLFSFHSNSCFFRGRCRGRGRDPLLLFVLCVRSNSRNSKVEAFVSRHPREAIKSLCNCPLACEYSRLLALLAARGVGANISSGQERWGAAVFTGYRNWSWLLAGMILVRKEFI